MLNYVDCFLSWCKIDNVGKLQDNYKQVFLKKMKKYGKNILKKLLRAKMVCRMKQNLEWKTVKARVTVKSIWRTLEKIFWEIFQPVPTCANATNNCITKSSYQHKRCENHILIKWQNRQRIICFISYGDQ